MHELNLLENMRADVPEPDLTGARERLHSVLYKGSVPRRPLLRVGLAAGAALAAAAVAGLVLVPHGRAPSGTTGTPADTPALRLAAAAQASANISFRYTASSTSSTDHWQIVVKGVWDPRTVQAYTEFYDTGLPGPSQQHPLREWSTETLIGTDLWMALAASPHEITHITVSARSAPERIAARISLPLAGEFTSPTIDPHTWIQQLLAVGGTIRDLGVSGQGASAVHTYGFVEQWDTTKPYCLHKVGTPGPCVTPAHPFPPGLPKIVTYQGTIAVGVQSGMIAKVQWTVEPSYVPEVPFPPTHSLSTVEYSDYGLPVHLTPPRG